MTPTRLLGRRPAKCCPAGALAALVFFGLLAQVAPSQAAPKARESRELRAREAFATGHYQEAIDLYGQLYAEKLHPTYLRNIGRCYQKLREPDKAIDTFRDYLSRAKNLTASEQKEIEGYIAEMEAERSHVADRLTAKLGRTRQPSISQTGTMPSPPATSPGSEPAKTPAWVQQIGGKKESRLAVLEFSGPIDASVVMMLSDEVRGVALKAVAEHHCSVMTRESMAVILKDMGRGECEEGDCEVETARNIGADFVVSGSVAKIEGSFVATLKLHETARGMLLASARATAPTALELIEAIKRSSAELFK